MIPETTQTPSKRSYLSLYGRVIDLWSITPDDILLMDVAHALSLLNRFGGHSRWPYPVSQHSVNVYREMHTMLLDVDKWLPLCQEIWTGIMGQTGPMPSIISGGDGYGEDWVSHKCLLAQALAHDFTEAYVQDLVRPVKRAVVGYSDLEQHVWESSIAPLLGLPDLQHPMVMIADNRMLLAERNMFTGFNPDDPEHQLVWGDLESKYGVASLNTAYMRQQSWTTSKRNLATAITVVFPEASKQDTFRQASWSV